MFSFRHSFVRLISLSFRPVLSLIIVLFSSYSILLPYSVNTRNNSFLFMRTVDSLPQNAHTTSNTRGMPQRNSTTTESYVLDVTIRKFWLPLKFWKQIFIINTKRGVHNQTHFLLNWRILAIHAFRYVNPIWHSACALVRTYVYGSRYILTLVKTRAWILESYHNLHAFLVVWSKYILQVTTRIWVSRSNLDCLILCLLYRVF